jgi:signal transduction histidine kinase/DNA-binding response OmpR family regulator
MENKRHILVVEDNPGDAELIRAILGKQGRLVRIHVEECLADALAYLDTRGSEIDVVLLDLGLPDSRGLSSIGKIRKRFPFLPIVVITGNDDENVGMEAVRQGAQDYVFKGLIPEHYLTQIVEYAIHRQNSEYRLKQSEEKYRSIVENIGIGVVMIDKDRQIVEVNNPMTRWFPEMSLKSGQKCYETIQCLCQGDPGHDKCPVARTFEDGLSHRGVGKQGDATYRLLSSPLRNDDGSVKGVVLLVEDISERISVEARLRQAQKMESLGTLAGGVAHDFNNILTAIQGYTTLAKYQAEENTQLMDDLVEILKASHRASDLVKQILTFSRMGESQKQPVRMDLIVKEVLKLLRSTLPSNIEIKTGIEKTRASVVADPTQIHQIMMNLCTNAAHAMEETGGTLEVTLAFLPKEACRTFDQICLPGRGCLKLVVRDTGTGIPPELMESIFDPYFTTKGIGQGTGLGLSVVQGIVTDCGGEILVTSSPGEGSCFTLYFPEAGDTAGAGYETRPGTSVQGTEAILLVDDEPSILKLGSRLLERRGYTVHTASNGRDALAFVHQNQSRVDLIVSDMTMPKMTGLDLAENLMKQGSRIPLIIMTGYSRMLSSQKAAGLGISAVVSKPLSDQNLISTVRKILDSRE